MQCKASDCDGSLFHRAILWKLINQRIAAQANKFHAREKLEDLLLEQFMT